MEKRSAWNLSNFHGNFSVSGNAIFLKDLLSALEADGTEIPPVQLMLPREVAEKVYESIDKYLESRSNSALASFADRLENQLEYLDRVSPKAA